MPLYTYNISTVTCLYLAILCLNTYKDISIKGKRTYNKLLSAFKAKPALYILLNKLLLPIIKVLLSLSIPLIVAAF
ncbi:unnamed protein product [Fusarium fujikuroi]|nr:unnamed protein product [Fusarium fujikuroi]